MSVSQQEFQRLDANRRDELNSAALYQALAELEKSPKLAEVYRRIAAVEQRHADAWAEKLRSVGVQSPEFKPSWRTQVLITLARRFGPGMVLPSIVTLEEIGGHDYARQVDAGAAMAAQEQSHARLLRHITRTTRGGLEGGAIAQIEGRHRGGGGNALRAAVLGANDGLVSNLSLVMGVAGASLTNQSILITGFAGLLAGACSMALGEWLSVQSSRELYLRQIGVEKEEIARSPQEEAEELALIYQARGLDEARAQQVAARIMEDEQVALDTLAREELGVDPDELGGSAWEAAITSFILFAIGAIIPVLPFVFMSDTGAIVVSIALSVLGLFAIGAAITLFTRRSVLVSGARQVGFGLAAAAITFGLGRLLGVGIAG